MHSIEHLPEFLRGINEFIALCDRYDTENVAIESGIDEIITNANPVTSDRAGLQHWAGILGLSDQRNDEIDVLRASVIGKFSERLPFTLRAFESSLTGALGSESAYKVKLTGFTIMLTILAEYYDKYQAVLHLCEVEIPANVMYSISPLSKNKGGIYVGCTVSAGQIIEIGKAVT